MKKRNGNDWGSLLKSYFGNKCGYCGKTTKLHLHHILPLYKDGANLLSNLELVCKGCHIALHNEMRKIYPAGKKTKIIKYAGLLKSWSGVK